MSCPNFINEKTKAQQVPGPHTHTIHKGSASYRGQCDSDLCAWKSHLRED